MAISRRRVAIGSAAVLILLSGCLSGPGVGGTVSPIESPTEPQSSSPPSASPSPSPSTSPSSPTAGCAEWVSFYGLGSPGARAWAPDRVAIGYTVSANASVLFVAFEDEDVIGSTHAETKGLDYGVTADGDGIPLSRRLSGNHTIRVRAYSDTNGNERFDPGTDTACREDGRVVETVRTIDFDPFGRTATEDSGTETGS